MIVVDASALIAIATGEPDASLYAKALEQSDTAYLSSPNYLETGLILVRRGIASGSRDVEVWLNEAGVSIRADLPLAADALDAYLRFGKGFHPARLNLGDCFAYALAKALDAPLLYKGDDFALTDVRSAL